MAEIRKQLAQDLEVSGALPLHHGQCSVTSRVGDRTRWETVEIAGTRSQKAQGSPCLLGAWEPAWCEQGVA